MTTSSWINMQFSNMDTRVYDLDAFLGLLYDDVGSKVKATHMIFLMSLNIDNLGAIATHTSAMVALARLLREEGRKSTQLRLNTVSTFLVFSFFQNFHQVLIENQIGRATLSLLEFENLRAQNVSIKTAKTQVEGTLNESKEENFSSFMNSSLNKNLHDQEKILYFSVYFLYNISGNVQIERKMRKFNLVECLCTILNRTNVLLLALTVKFLKKLSIYKENLLVIKECGITFRLLHMLHFDDESLLEATLQLLFNLSFDRGFREEMIDNGCIQTLGALLQDSELKFTRLVSCLLYNLSMDLDLRLKISESNIPSILFKIVKEQDFMSQELNALTVNLTSVPKTFTLNVDISVCEKFIKDAVQTRSILLYKIMKNLSSLKAIRIQWSQFLQVLVDSILHSELPIQVEVMGILNNLTYLEVLGDSLLANSGLLNYLSTRLDTNGDDDINLEIIMFVGGVCSNVNAAKISQIGLVSSTCAVFAQRRTDADIILQSLYTMIRFLSFDATREAFLQIFEKIAKFILELSQAASYILELSQDADKYIMRMADNLIDMIFDLDDTLASTIRKIRFNMYNQGWLESQEVL